MRTVKVVTALSQWAVSEEVERKVGTAMGKKALDDVIAGRIARLVLSRFGNSRRLSIYWPSEWAIQQMRISLEARGILRTSTNVIREGCHIAAVAMRIGAINTEVQHGETGQVDLWDVYDVVLGMNEDGAKKAVDQCRAGAHELMGERGQLTLDVPGFNFEPVFASHWTVLRALLKGAATMLREDKKDYLEQALAGNKWWSLFEKGISDEYPGHRADQLVNQLRVRPSK